MNEDIKIKFGGDVSGLRSAMRDAQSAVNGLVSFATTAFFRAGVAVAGWITTASLIGATFDKQMRIVRAVTMATEEEFKKLTDLAKKMGAETEFTARDAAEGLKYLGQAGLTAKQSMAALPGILDLATTGEMKLADAAEIAVNVMFQFGLQAEQLGRLNDALARGAILSTTSVEGLATGFVYAGTQARMFGMDVEQVTALLALLSNQGIKGSMAGTTLRQSMMDLLVPQKDMVDILEKYNVMLYSANGQLRNFVDILLDIVDAGLQSAEAAKAFGVRGGLIASIFKMGSTELEIFIQKLYTMQAGAKDVADQIRQSFWGKWKEMLSKMESMWLETFDSIEDHGIKVFAAVGEGALQLKNYIKTHARDIKDSLQSMFTGTAAVIYVAYNAMSKFIAGLHMFVALKYRLESGGAEFNLIQKEYDIEKMEGYKKRAGSKWQTWSNLPGDFTEPTLLKLKAEAEILKKKMAEAERHRKMYEELMVDWYDSPKDFGEKLGKAIDVAESAMNRNTKEAWVKKIQDYNARDEQTPWLDVAERHLHAIKPFSRTKAGPGAYIEKPTNDDKVRMQTERESLEKTYIQLTGTAKELAELENTLWREKELRTVKDLKLSKSEIENIQKIYDEKKRLISLTPPGEEIFKDRMSYYNYLSTQDYFTGYPDEKDVYKDIQERETKAWEHQSELFNTHINTLMQKEDFAFQMMVGLSERTAEAMEQNFSNLFFDVMTGKLGSLADITNAVLTSMARVASDYMGQLARIGMFGNEQGKIGGIVGDIIKGIGNMMGRGGQSAVTQGYMSSSMYNSVYHHGGIVGVTSAPQRIVDSNMFFSSARKLHGGLATNEYPAILRKGERVYNPSENGPNIQFVLNNESGQQMEASSQSGPKWDGSRWVIEVVLTAMQNSPSFRTAMRGR